MLIPQVIGFEMTGRLPEGATATDLVLTVTQMLRAKGVVEKFVEFFGDGLNGMPLADRATISNMAPEYGATCGIFPIDEETIRYLQLSGRPDEQLALVEAYAKAQGMWREKGSPPAQYTDVLRLDLSTVEPSLAGPKRPQDRVTLKAAKGAVEKAINDARAARKSGVTGGVPVKDAQGRQYELGDGAVVIAAITSCTNTSNPSVMVGAGLLAKKAVQKGLKVKPWVKTSLAPGSLVVRDYLDKAGLTPALNELGFNIVGYGCTTCIGNSGPLPEAVSEAIKKGDLTVSAILSGNRNFEGRVHAEVKMNFLASPPLVVAYAIAGTMNFDPYKEPIGKGSQGEDVYLKDIWPSQKEIQDVLAGTINSAMFRKSYSNVFAGDARWSGLRIPATNRYGWRADSTYVQNPPYFAGMGKGAEGIQPIQGARVLAKLGDSVTTDHISPAGSIKADSPAGKYLIEHGVKPADFNSYGSRRGNHEVMMRGTFANIRLRNQLAPGTEGGWTRHQPGGEQMTIYDASVKYRAAGVPLMVIAGKEYGSGSSRDWAAKGTQLLGIKAVIAESFERIHRSNLVNMGVLPLEFKTSENAATLGLTGTEVFSLVGAADGLKPRGDVKVAAVAVDGTVREFMATARIDTPEELVAFRHGGILPYVVRQLVSRS